MRAQAPIFSVLRLPDCGRGWRRGDPASFRRGVIFKAPPFPPLLPVPRDGQTNSSSREYFLFWELWMMFSGHLHIHAVLGHSRKEAPIHRIFMTALLP